MRFKDDGAEVKSVIFKGVWLPRTTEVISSEMGGANSLWRLTNHCLHHERVLEVADSVTVLRFTLGDT